jgi:TPR repeat protein
LTGAAFDQARGPADIAAVRKAAEAGDVRAQRSLADLHMRGDGVSRDRAEALSWYRKAADRGDAYSLGVVYAEGVGVEQDLAQAVIWYRKAADLGDASAQGALGSLYYFGGSIFNPAKSLPKDFTQARVWLEKAAEQGEPGAMANLSMMHVEAKGVPRDLVQALKWIRLSGSRAVGPAQQALKGRRQEHRDPHDPGADSRGQSAR